MKTIYTAVVTREKDWYLARVQGVQGAHTEAKSLKELLVMIKDVLELCLDLESGQLDDPDECEILLVNEAGEPYTEEPELPAGVELGGSTFHRL